MSMAALAEQELRPIRAIEPFAQLGDEVLVDAFGGAEVRYFPRGALVCAGDAPLSGLWVLRSGAVRLRGTDEVSRGGSQDLLAVGAIFPIEAATAGGLPWFDYVASDDSFLWYLDEAQAARLLGEPAMLRWVARAALDLGRRMRAALRETRQESQVNDQILSLPALEVGSRRVVCVPGSASIAEVAAVMQAERLGAVIVGSAEQPIGIVSESDLVHRALARRLPPETPAGAIMTAAPQTISVNASTLDASIAMVRNRRRHLPICGERGELVGMVSARDIAKAQQQGMAHIARTIDAAASTAELVAIASDARRFFMQAFRGGLGVSSLMRLLSSTNDRIVERVLEQVLAPQHVGQNFCWLAFGSEGREEQGFVTDQDNGIVFVPSGEDAIEMERAALLESARRANEALHSCGFELCKGGIMAGNPAWCLSLSEWQRKFSSWISATTPVAIMHSTIFFDFRPIFGNAALADAMRDHLFAELRGNSLFPSMLARNALEAEPPIGKLGRLKTSGGEHKGTLDLKIQGSRLFVDFARVYALAQGVRAVGTEQRLVAIGERLKRSATRIEGDISAWRFVQTVRLRRQLESADDGGPANRLDPTQLNDLDRRMLVESFKQAQLLQDRMRLDYLR